MSEPTQRVRIVWTHTAADSLRKLPKKVRAGILAKADELEDCEDPRAFHKPLTGPLHGYYRLTYARYRAVYTVSEDEILNGDVLVTVTVCFVAVGKREEHSKNDVYKLAQRAVELGLVDPISND